MSPPSYSVPLLLCRLFGDSLETSEKSASSWNAELQKALKDKKLLEEKKSAMEKELNKLKNIRAYGAFVILLTIKG